MKQKELIFYLENKEFKQSANGFVPFDESTMDRGRSIFDAIELCNGVFIYIDVQGTHFFGHRLYR